MKIQMIHDRLAKGGQERQIIELLKSFKLRPNIEVELVFFSDEVSYPEIYDLGYPVHLLKRNYKIDPGAIYRYYKLCKKFQPDIIHSWGLLSSVYALFPVNFLKIPFINQNVMDATKGMNIFHSKYFKAKIAFPFSDVIIGNSKTGLEMYRAPRSKSICIYNGFDFGRAKILQSPEEVRKQLKIKPGPIVGMVGAFHKRKDFDTFIAAAIQLLDKGHEINFLAIGDGANFDRCKSMIPAKYEDRILLPGQLNQVESVVNCFNVGVLATNSKVHGEGISNSIIEYMVFAKPVVATDGGGTPEIVEDNVTGFLVPAGSVEKLSERIEYLTDRPELAVEMGKKGQIRVKNDFSVQKMEKQYLELYEKIMKR